MAAQSFSKLGVKLLSIPLILTAEICLRLNLFSFRDDLAACLLVSDRFSSDNISNDLFNILIIAEDRRNAIHSGVDPISIVRAIVHLIFLRKIEGASTIEQQFVRVVTGRYKRTIARKLREQIVAISLTRLRSKRLIASAYIQIAFYGKDLEWLIESLNCPLATMGLLKSAALVARLKYPEPSFVDPLWRIRFERRLVYIQRLLLAAKTSDTQLVPIQIFNSR
jgi:membrane carboxypeptidase/penicillin-binding protein PbpC